MKLIFKKQVIDNQWKIDDEDLKDEWFESKMATFKHYGRDMETLFSKVKIAHGRRIFCKLDCEIPFGMRCAIQPELIIPRYEITNSLVFSNNKLITDFSSN